MAEVTLDFLSRQISRLLEEQRDGQESDRTGVRELSSLNARLDTLATTLDLTRKIIERKVDLLRLELLDELTTQARMEAAGGRAPLEARVDTLEARLAAITQLMGNVTRGHESIACPENERLVSDDNL